MSRIGSRISLLSLALLPVVTAGSIADASPLSPSARSSRAAAPVYAAPPYAHATQAPAQPAARHGFGGLLEMLFREQIENQTVEVKHFAGDPAGYANRRAQRSLCHLLAVSTGGADVETGQAVTTDLTIRGPRPLVRIGDQEPAELPTDDAVECWTATLERLLMVWV